MSDFVKRLRTLDGLRCPTTRELEAAARIEALEVALRTVVNCPDNCEGCRKYSRTTLAGSQE